MSFPLRFDRHLTVRSADHRTNRDRDDIKQQMLRGAIEAGASRRAKWVELLDAGCAGIGSKTQDDFSLPHPFDAFALPPILNFAFKPADFA